MKPLFLWQFGKIFIRSNSWPSYVLILKVDSILCMLQIKIGSTLLVIDDLTQKEANYIIMTGNCEVEKEKERLEKRRSMPKL